MLRVFVICAFFLNAPTLLGLSHLEPQSIEQHCKGSKSPTYFKRRLASAESRIAFENQGGLANAGVCWWHSRLQRKAVYLSIMRPELPKPSVRQASEIIKKIKTGKSLVQIPGYATFKEFTHQFENEVQHALESWQRVEGFLQFAWISGLHGSPKPGPQKMAKNLKAVFSEVALKNRIGFVHLQLPGVTNHAWLIHSISKGTSKSNLGSKEITAAPGQTHWRLKVIDSNYPAALKTIQYSSFSPSLMQSNGVPFAPYLAEEDESKALEQVIQSTCGSRIFSSD